jgi:hypothetical protein
MMMVVMTVWGAGATDADHDEHDADHDFYDDHSREAWQEEQTQPVRT